MCEQGIGAPDGNPYYVGNVSKSEQSVMPAEFAIFNELRQFPGVNLGGLSSYGCNIDKLSKLASKHLWEEIFPAFLIPDIVLSPCGVWLVPDNTICFAGYPTGKFAESVHLMQQMTILQTKVFVCNFSVQGIANHWVWETPDSDGSGFPSNHGIHSGKLIWTPEQQPTT